MSSEKLTFKGTVIWLICALFFTYEFLLRTVLGTFEPSIAHDLSLTPLSFAILSSSAYQLVYALMQMPASAIAERLGLRWTLFFSCLLCAGSIGIFATSTYFISALVFRVLTGLGASFGFICLLLAVYEWMPQSKIAYFIGLSQFVGTMGPMMAGGPLQMLTEHNHLSWRSIHLILSTVGFFLALLIVFIVRNKKVFVGTFQVLTKAPPAYQAIKQVLTNTQVLAIACYSALSFFTIEFLSENAGKQFLMLNGHSQAFSANMISIAWFSYAIGCPLLGMLSDLSHKRRDAMIVSALAALIAILLITYASASSLVTVIAFILLGLGASGQSIGFVIITEQLTASMTALSLGFNNAVIGLFIAINSPIIGSVLYYYAGNKPAIADYQHSFLILIAASIIGLLLVLGVIKETFCKSKADLHVLSP